MKKNSENKRPRIKTVRNLEAEHAKKASRHEDFIKYQMIDFVKNKKKHSKEDIEHMVGYMGFHTKETEYEPLDNEAKKVIRLDASGFIRVTRYDRISKGFKKALKNPEINKTKPRDYDLNNLSCWKYMKLFESYRDFDVLIKKSLVKRKVDPEALSKMKFEDVCFLFSDYAPKPKKGAKPNSTFKIFEGAKHKFAKHLATKYQQEYFGVLKNICNSKSEVEKYMNLAKKCGVLHHNLEVHHNDMVANANCLEQISKVNDISNFIAVNKDIHKFLHSAYYTSNKFDSSKETVSYAYSKNDIIVAGRTDGYRVFRKKEKPARVIQINRNENNHKIRIQRMHKMAR